MGSKYDRLGTTAEKIRKYRRILTVAYCRRFSGRYHIGKLDALIVDTEDADWMAIKQLDLQRYQPRIVYFEYDHLPNREPALCLRHFRAGGYRVYLDERGHENFLALRCG
jgi:hypothetical protein